MIVFIPWNDAEGQPGEIIARWSGMPMGLPDWARAVKTPIGEDAPGTLIAGFSIDLPAAHGSYRMRTLADSRYEAETGPNGDHLISARTQNDDDYARFYFEPVGSQGSPTISSVRTAGSDPSAGIAPNAWVEIRGSNLVPASTPADGTIWSKAPEFIQGKMPTNLNGISVTVNGQAAYIYYFCSSATDKVCPQDQINVLTPLDSTVGTVQVVVSNNGVTGSPFAVNLAKAVPSFFRWPGNYAVATHANNGYLGPTSLYPGVSTPAKPNETITLWMTGFGLPKTNLVQGSATQSSQLPTNPVIQFNGTPGTVQYSGVVSPGLYIVNVTVPSNAANGDNFVTVTYNGVNGPSGYSINVAH